MQPLSNKYGLFFTSSFDARSPVHLLYFLCIVVNVNWQQKSCFLFGYVVVFFFHIIFYFIGSISISMAAFSMQVENLEFGRLCALM